MAPADEQSPAPAVVAVVVTCDPGPWFDQVLSALAAQDYPNMSVLVVDAASSADPSPVVAAALPGAFVRRLDRRVGFGSAANEVKNVVEGASHYLFCHDDVLLAPDAVRLLVEEAFRSNAAVTSPKYLQWDAPERLLAVGATADRVGVVQDLIEPGELDQEQHDAVREVLVAPSGATLVRADLFDALGGFDERVDQFGEDLNLCWRARVVGARVTVVPSARVMHLQAVDRGVRVGWSGAAARHRAARAAESNRVRTLLTCYRWFDVLWVLPLALAWLLGEAATRLLQGRPGVAWQALASFFAGFRDPSQLWRSRRALQSHRRVGDAAIRRFQSRGNARFRTFIRSRVEGVREGLPPGSVSRRPRLTDYEDDSDDGSNIGYAGGYPSPEPAAPEEVTPAATDRRLVGLILLAVLIVLVVGSRGLLGREIPSVGRVPDVSGGVGSLWRDWWSTWQQTGLGISAPSSPALGLLAIAGTLLGGAVGSMQHVVVLGPLLLGPIGAYRAARWWGSRRAQLAAAVVYAVCPLPYNAVSRGHWGALVAFGAAPWILGWLGRLSGEAPFPTTAASRVWYRAAAVGLLVTVVAAVEPAFVYVVPLVGIGLLLGSILAGRAGGGVRVLMLSVAVAAEAVVLLLPWSATVLGSRVATLGPDPGSLDHLGLGAVLRFQTGPFGHGLLGWALLVVAALPLFIGRGWRLVWAARLWSVALVCVAAAWSSSRGWIPPLPADLVLTPAVAAFAGSAALGAAAFELDLPGYRFGWRQLSAGVAALMMTLATVPFVAAAAGGRWKIPTTDPASEVAFLPDNSHGDYRVLWVGATDALPAAGYQLSPGVAYATSYDGPPGPDSLWLSRGQGGVSQLAADIDLVEGGRTTKLGHLLAPAGIRYIVIPNHTAPAGSGGFPAPVPATLLQGLQLQTDLQLVNLADANYSIYLNAAWMPVKALLPRAAVPIARAGSDPASSRELQQVDLSKATPLVADRFGVAAVTPGSTTYVGESRNAGWRLDVGSASLRPSRAFGWAMRFDVPGHGAQAVRATLRKPSSVGIRAVQVVEVAAWLLVIMLVTLDIRRRRAEEPDPEVVRADWFVPVSPAADRHNWRRSHQARGAEEMQDDEVWLDV